MVKTAILICSIILISVFVFAMVDEKVYVPTEIVDSPLPQADTASFATSQPVSTESFGQQTTQDQPLPVKKIAHEVIGQSLNTEAKKILQQFDFADSGAIRIGTFQEGIAGDIRLTPLGIVARDESGNTTFSLDAETGSALFKGTVQAGDVTVVDEQGLVSLASFASDIVQQNGGINTVSATYVDVTGVSITFTLEREAHIVFMYNAHGYNAGNLSHAQYCYVVLVIDGVSVDNGNLNNTLFLPGNVVNNNLAILETSASNIYMTTLKAGTHTAKLQYRTTDATTTAILDGSSLAYMLLGR